MQSPDWLEKAVAAVSSARAAAPPVEAELNRLAAGCEAASPPALEEIARLLTAHDPGFRLLAAAARVRESVFGRTVGLFAPLYYSNVCANDCVYCGFRSSLGGTRRRVLTEAEVGSDARVLLAHGHRRILLIASEDPSPRGLALALGAVRAVRAAAGDRVVSLALEMAPRAREDFARLAEAGVSGYILFQETYDRSLYSRVHPAGPKSDFAHRLEGPGRAFGGGIRQLGLGVLYGLGDPVFETVALVAHARELARTTGREVASVSVPRLEPAEGVEFTTHPPHPVSDDLWLRLVAVLRLALPRTDLIVSTREQAALRRASLRAGATVFSAGSRTDPGGYQTPGRSREQFEVGDQRSLQDVEEDLKALGYNPSRVPGAPVAGAPLGASS